MSRLQTLPRLLALALVAVSLLLPSLPAAAQEETEQLQLEAPKPPEIDPEAEARKAQIFANLELRFPRLGELDVTMGAIEPSPYAGLDQGSFTVNMPQGSQVQKFLVAHDNSVLYLVNEEVDVSRSAAEIAAEIAAREAVEAEQAAKRREEIAAAVEGLPVRGNPDAPVTIVEFSDFQCPYCTRGAATMNEVLAKYPEDVKFVFKHFPLGFHNWARPAAIASHCAGEQKGEAFWTLHDKYFADQKQITAENLIDKSREYLADAGLDLEAWATCATDPESEAYKAAAATVDADMAFGQKNGVTGTPGFFVNGEFISGAQPLSAFVPLIEKAKQGS